jgi:phosphatidylglycerophosphate synthase
MPSRFRLRIIFKPLVQAVAKGFARAGWSPNTVTSLVIILSAGALAWLLLAPLGYWSIVVFGAIVFVVGVLDGVDGALARLTGRSTKFGGIYDSSVDRLSDAAIFFAPALREVISGGMLRVSWLPLPWLWVLPFWAWSFLLVIGTYMISYIRARATLADPAIDADVGLLGRSERLFVLVVASACNVIPLIIVVLAVLVNATAIFRLIRVRKTIHEE